MATVLGIDLGIASVGFALVDAENAKIIALGSRIFEAAEHPKDGSSLALPRRLARGRRRTLRRRRSRLKEIVRLFEHAGFIGVHGLAGELLLHAPAQNPWQLRKEGLERPLTDVELARALYHIAKHRGFQSNRKEKIELAQTKEGKKEEDKERAETKKMLESIGRLKEQLKAAGTPTVGAFLASQPKKRNDPSEYTRTVERDWLREEVQVLLERQRKFGQVKATEELAAAFCEIAFSQKPIQPSIDMVGYCELEPDELRAPKNAYTAEQFIALSKLTNLRILTMGRAFGRPLDPAEREKLLAIARELKNGVTFTRARKELGIADDERFNLAVYRKTGDEDTWEKIRKKAEDKALISLKGFHELKAVIEPADKGLWAELLSDPARLDQIAFALSFFTEEADIAPHLAKAKLPKEIEKRLIESIDFTKTIDLSLKALYKILPHMQMGLGYAEACAEAGYHHSKKTVGVGDHLPPIPSTRNPVVDRSLAQARKVINAVIKHKDMGMPDRIHIEFSRDLSKPMDERRKLHKQNLKFEEQKVKLLTEMKSEVFENKKEQIEHAEEIFGTNLKREDLFLKYRLWKDQGGFCLYTGEAIKPHHLKDPLAVQIDHALPRSRSWDNSYSNKVLCFTYANQEKGNRTPYEYLCRDGSDSRWTMFEAIVRDKKALGFQKRRKLFMKDFDEKAEGEFKERNLNDTRYMARKLKEHIEANLKPKTEGKQFVMSVNGPMTAMLRGMWGLEKSRDNDLHHAVDAAVVACATQGMVTKVNNWHRYNANGVKTGGKKIEKPWPEFRENLLDRLAKVFVSRQPVRKLTGQGHDETILSGRKIGDKTVYVKKVGLGSLTLEKLADIVDVEVIDGQPTGRNKRLYETLKERLEAFGGKADKAFAEPIRMPTNDPAKPGPVIRGVRVRTNDKSLLPVRGGFAGNATMSRVDVYTRGGKFYLVPVYAHQVAKNEIPDYICTIKKSMDGWDRLDETYSLLMCLYKNDYIVVDQGPKIMEGYFVGMDIATASITLKPHHNHDGANIRSIGVKTAKSITKYVVNVFGEKFMVKKGK